MIDEKGLLARGRFEAAVRLPHAAARLTLMATNASAAPLTGALKLTALVHLRHYILDEAV